MQRWHLGLLMMMGALSTTLALAQASAGSAPQAKATPPAAAAKLPRPTVFFKEEWKQTAAGGEHPVGLDATANPNVELKLYVPAGEMLLTGSANDESNPIHVWTGMCTSPCAAAFREKNHFADLSGLARIRWNTKTSGFHQVRPIVKLADGTWLVGDRGDGTPRDWLISEVSFADLRWLKLDIARVVTVGPFVEKVDLSRVDEIGFADLMPSSGHGPGGWSDVAQVEVFGGAVARAAPADIPKSISDAVADASRPDEDRQRDAARHPAELLAFAGVKPGQKIADYMSGGGYFTRIFAKAVGPKGHVYAVWPNFVAEHDKEDAAKIKALAATRGYSNVSYALTADDRFTVSEPLDLVWTSQNYHDLQFGLKPEQIVQLDKAIFAALKPGGVYLVIDHVAEAGSGWSAARTLHRIDPAVLKADMAAAGFVLEVESDVLRNPADPHTAAVFDPSIRGKTDQVVLKFVRPK